jgi:hypothetical protein
VAAMTIYGKLLGPASAALVQSALTVTLVDYNNEPAGGFDTVNKTEVLSQLPVAVNADGTWTAQLLPNAQLRLAAGSAATAWRVTEGGSGATFTYWIVVVAGDPAVPVWVGDLVTTLVGGAAYPTPVNLALGGNLTVAGTFTYAGVPIAVPPGDASKFLAGDGTWRVGGGAVSSVNGLDGAVVLNAAAVSAIPVAAEGVAGGVATLDGAGLLTPAQLPTARIRSTRLDQFAAPTADVAMGGHSLTGGAPGVASTDFATVSQLPTSSRDPYTSMLGLVSQPYPLDATDNDNLGTSAGALILALNRPGAVPITNLGLWLQTAGTGPGAASMAVFPATGGARLAVTGDMSAALTTSLNNDTYVEAPLIAPYTAADATNYYYALFTNFAADAKIAGVYGGLHIPIVKGNHPMIVILGLSAMPSTIDISTAIAAGAAYWLVGS